MKYRTKRLCQRCLYALTALMMTISVLFSSGTFGTGIARTAAADAQGGKHGKLKVSNFELMINGKAAADGITVKDGDPVILQLEWFIENNQTYLEDGEYKQCTVFEADFDTFGIDMTKIPMLDSDEPRALYDSDGTLIGTFSIKTDHETEPATTKLLIELDKTVAENRSNIGGGAYFDGKIYLNPHNEDMNGEKCTVGFADKTFEAIYNDRGYKKQITVEKSTKGNVKYDDNSGTYYQDYTIKVTLNGEINNPTLTDDLAAMFGGKLYGDITCDPDYKELTVDGNSFTMTFDDVPEGKKITYTITYSLEVPREDIIACEQDGSSKIEEMVNTATITGVDTNGREITDSSTASPSIIVPSISKVGTVVPDTDFRKADSDHEYIYAYDESTGKYYAFVEYEITIKLGTSSQELSEDDIYAALLAIKDTPDKNLKPYYFNKDTDGNYILVTTGEEVEKAKRVLNKEITKEDFSEDEDNDSYYILSYYLAFETDPYYPEKTEYKNSATITDPVPGRDIVFEIENELIPDVGIDVMDKEYEYSSDQSRAKFNVTLDFGRLEKYDNANNFVIKDTLPTNALYVDSINIDATDFDQEQFDFLSNFNISFVNQKGEKVTIYLNDKNWSADGPGRPINNLCMYKAPYAVPANDIFKPDYIILENGYWKISRNNNIKETIPSPFDFRYNESTFIIDNFDETFIKALMDSGIKLVLSYSTKNNPSTPSTTITNTAELTYTVNPIDPEDENVDRSERDTDQGTFSTRSVDFEMKKSHLETGDSFKAYTHSSNYNPETDQWFFQPTKDGLSTEQEKQHIVYNEEGTITWKLEIPVSKLTTNIKTFKITDTIPDGLTLVDDSVFTFLSIKTAFSQASYENNYYWLKDYEHKARVISKDNNKYTFAFSSDTTMPVELVKLAREARFPNDPTNLKYENLVIIYKTTIDKEFLNGQEGDTYEFVNEAIPTINGSNKNTVTDRVEESIPHILNKTGVPDQKFTEGCRRASYTLNINEGADKLNNGEALTITDTLPAKFILDEDSVKVFKVNNGSEVLTEANVDYDEETNSFSIELEDEQAYKVQYEVKINLSPVPGWNTAETTTNRAALTGASTDGEGSSHNFATVSMSANVWAYDADSYLVINKFYIDENGEKQDLSGAEFELYRVYDNKGTVYMDEESIGKREKADEVLVTDENGLLFIEGLQLDSIYKLVEVTAPELPEAEDGTRFMDPYSGGYYFKLIGNSGVIDPRDDTRDDTNLKALQEEITAALGDELLPEHASDAMGSAYIEYENFVSIDIEGTKTWEVFEEFGNTAPDFGNNPVELELKRNDVVVADAKPEWTKVSDTLWSFKYTDLPKYDENHKKYVYTVTEKALNGYKPSYDDYNITNTLDTVDISVQKKWTNDDKFVSVPDNSRPNITIILMANGTEVKRQVITAENAEASNANVWSCKFEKLPKYDVSGKAIVYSVKEEGAYEGYVPTYEPANAVGNSTTDALAFTVTNAFAEEMTSLTIKKQWVDDNNSGKVRPDSITVQLYADGAAYGDVITLTADDALDDDANTWIVTPKSLPKYSSYKLEEQEDGTYKIVGDKEIVYTAGEVVLGDEGYYQPSYDGFVIVNTLDYGETSVSITKSWKDDSDNYKLRPASIKITLLADGQAIKTAEINAKDNATEDANTWSYSFTGLNKYAYKDGARHEVVYTVEEDTVIRYETSYESVDDYDLIINNTLKTTTITSNKMDTANKVEVEKAELELYDVNGKLIDSWTSAKNATWTINDLVPGLNYTIKEKKNPDGYEMAEDTVFYVDTEGKIHVESGKDASVVDGVLIINDTAIEVTKTVSVTIRKCDIINGVDVPMAKLYLYDSENKKISEWISKSGESWIVDDLIPDEKYTIKEIETPDKYKSISTDIVFKINENGVVNVISGMNDGVVDKETGALIVNNTLKEVESSSESESQSSSESGSESESQSNSESTSESESQSNSESTSESESQSSSESTSESESQSSSESSSESESQSSSESSSSSSSSSSRSESTAGNNESPKTGSAPSNTCAAIALISFAAAIVVGKSKKELESENESD